MLRIEIDTSNAAFDDNPGPELARILRTVIADIEYVVPEQGYLRDVNGNTVGEYQFTATD